MGIFKILFGGKAKEQRPHDAGVDEEHAALRRAIERCDSFKFAVDARQMSIADVVGKLLQNDFSKAIVRKAIAECFSEDAAEKHVK